MQVHGAWIIELNELDCISRSSSGRIKAFMSAQFDRFRLPYGKQLSTWQRGCVFAGTTNLDDYLRDPTGGRRFWPVTCGEIDLEALESNRDQLWAEAVERWGDGATWWLDDEDSVAAAEAEQAARFELDPWAER